MEDQYVVGDLIQVNGETGRVEHLTLRRTVMRNPRERSSHSRTHWSARSPTSSRDWSQVFVDVTIPSDEMIGRASATSRRDLRRFPQRCRLVRRRWWTARACSGVESMLVGRDRLRLQVRTILNRKDDVARELRRRIKLAFEESAIPLSHNAPLS